MTLQSLYQNNHGSLPPWRWAKTATQMSYNESRGYPEAEVEEESSGSAPVALGLLAPGFWKPQGQDVEGSWKPLGQSQMFCPQASNV